MSFPHNKSATLSTAYALTAVSCVIILLRVILRRVRCDKFQIDDYLMLAAGVFYAFNTAACPVVVWNGRNTYVKDSRKLTMNEVQQITLGSKWALIDRPFYLSLLWTLKTCILFYFMRLTSREMEIMALKCAAVFLGITWLICMLSFFLECRPFELYWQVLPETPECAKAIIAAIVLQITDFTTDIMIVFLSVPLILRMKRRVMTKLLLIGLIFVGVIAISMIRLMVVAADVTEQNKLIWAQIECFVATVVVNAPIIYGLWSYGSDHPESRKSENEILNGNSVPEYTLSIRRATTVIIDRNSSSDEEEQHWNEGDQLHPKRNSKVRDGIRKSIRELSDKIRRSLDLIEIERHTEIVQDTRARENSGGSAGKPGVADTFFGSGPIAHISTHISTNSLSSKGRRTKPRIFRE